MMMMSSKVARREARRSSPRVGTMALCWESIAGREHSSLAVDLSSHGVRLERPFVAGMARGVAPLQLEIPEVDEVVWARGEPCFDEVVPGAGPLGLVRRTGYRIDAAGRDLRMLADYVHAKHDEQVVYEDQLRRAREAKTIYVARCYTYQQG